MSKPYTQNDLSDIYDEDLIWRRKELSDLKTAAKAADQMSRPVLLRAVIAMCYAHWEGYVRTCANRYFEHLALRKKSFAEFERQIYVNSMLARVDAVSRGRVSLAERCSLINDILDSGNGRFAYVNPDLIDTQSNLKTDVIKDICAVCGVDANHFEENRTFIDVILLKRRNAIAHGQPESIDISEIDDLIAGILALMGFFRTLLENKIYTKAYAA